MHYSLSLFGLLFFLCPFFTREGLTVTVVRWNNLRRESFR